MALWVGCVLLLCLGSSGCGSTGAMVVVGLFQWVGQNQACKQGAGSGS
jgi:hypothetical protein